MAQPFRKRFKSRSRRVGPVTKQSSSVIVVLVVAKSQEWRLNGYLKWCVRIYKLLARIEGKLIVGPASQRS